MSILYNILTLIRIYIDYIIDYIFGLYYNSPNRVSKISNPLLLESASSLARKIRERQITSEDLVKACIGRIKDVNPIINAVIDERFELALAEAREVDADIKNNTADFENKPFLGVPFTTKDTNFCKGMKMAFGLLCRKDLVAEEDADVVLAVKKAGGILLALTNVPPLCLWIETDNPVYGRTNNPYDITRNVGGSSGGEAAIVAACGSPIGLGTDIGGSIRIPSFMCGLFGHKPTHDLMPLKGICFLTGEEETTMVTAGPIAKYSEDLIPFLKVLLGDNVSKLKLDEHVNVANLNIYYITSFNTLQISSIGDEMKQVITRTIKYFGDNSKKVPQELNLVDFAKSMDIWRHWIAKELGDDFLKVFTNGQEVSFPWEVVKFVTRTSELNIYTMMAFLNNLLLNPDDKWACEITSKLKTELLAKLGNNGVLLCPSAPWSARYHYTSVLRPLNFGYFAIWNALKMPVTQVPLGLDKEGLPVGIQVVAAPYQDHLCIAVAKELEKAFGGYVPPNTVDI